MKLKPTVKKTLIGFVDVFSLDHEYGAKPMVIYPTLDALKKNVKFLMGCGIYQIEIKTIAIDKSTETKPKTP